MIGHSESQAGYAPDICFRPKFSYTPVQGQVFPDGGDRLGAAVGLSDYNTVELPFCNLPQAFFLSAAGLRQTVVLSSHCRESSPEVSDNSPFLQKYVHTEARYPVRYQK